MPLLEQLLAFTTSTAATPWIYLLVFALVTLDGFFPPVPGETVLVAVAALSASTGDPALIWIVAAGAAGAAGAIAGDSIAYAIGSRLGRPGRPERRSRPRVARAVERARAELHRRPVTLLATARYIPVERVVVNVTAGLVRYPVRRFLPITAIAGAGWSAFVSTLGLAEESAREIHDRRG